MKVLMLENFFIWFATCGVSRQRYCSNGITVVGKVSGNEILALELLLFIPVLNRKLKSIRDDRNPQVNVNLTSKLDGTLHCLGA